MASVEERSKTHSKRGNYGTFRIRNDSGYDEDDPASAVEISKEEFIRAWSSKAHSIVSKEVSKMKRELENSDKLFDEARAEMLTSTAAERIKRLLSGAVGRQRSSGSSESLEKIPEEKNKRKRKRRARKNKKSSPVWKRSESWTWNDQQHQSQEDVPEEIFSDWLLMRRREEKQRKGKNFREINDIFWNISLEEDNRRRRRRSISQVLDNLPFDDHPDIFNDRCELLEPHLIPKSDHKMRKFQQRNAKVVPNRSRPVKLYWNIFSEWKHVFNEKKAAAAKRPFRPPKRGNADKRVGRIFNKRARRGWYHHPMKYVETEIRAIMMGKKVNNNKKGGKNNKVLANEKEMAASRREFCRLRDEVRAMRKCRRNSLRSEVAIFRDGRKWIFGEEEQEFERQEEDVEIFNDAKFLLFNDENQHQNNQLPIPKKSVYIINGKIPFPELNKSSSVDYVNKNQNKKKNSRKSDKIRRQLSAKCFAQQPLNRGRS